MKVCHHIFKDSDPEGELMNAFRVLDVDGNGTLDRQELEKWVVEKGLKKMGDAEVQAFLDMADTNGDGKLVLYATNTVRQRPHISRRIPHYRRDRELRHSPATSLCRARPRLSAHNSRGSELHRVHHDDAVEARAGGAQGQRQPIDGRPNDRPEAQGLSEARGGGEAGAAKCRDGLY